ncbi:hypothetical protein EDB85DRAFT_2009936 [Lactarius pseudohatsudake]|nr:hypothetical protein EDB85DRAFT_2009936 [Lactarius pseudohatsudake]
MRGFALFFTLVAVAAVLAAAAVGTYHFFRRRRDHLTPPHTSYYPSPFNSGATGIQTKKVYRPPPLPLSYTQSSYQSSATYAYGQSAPTPPAPPDYSRGVYHSSASSPHVRTPSQTQQPPKTPAPPDSGRGVYHSSVASPRAQALNWTQLSSTRTQSPSRVPAREPTESEPRPPTAPAVVSSGFRPDEPTSVEDVEYAKKLREQARRRGREMTEAYSRAKSAQKKGLRGASQAHRQEAMAHESAKKELDKQAAKIIFRENNKNRKDGMIDLHGLHVPEAVRLAKDQVETARSRGDEPVRFIVGKGLHSNAGEAKIRPALEDLFNKRGLTHSLDPRNAGVLIVRPD